jgi:hypothetical protein
MTPFVDMAWSDSLTSSSDPSLALPDLERDLPVSEDDVRVLNALRHIAIDEASRHPNRFRTPGWTKEKTYARPTFEGAEEFWLPE